MATIPQSGVKRGYSYFECDGALFRRNNSTAARSVDDVLIKGKWQPYKGADPLYPALFGDEIDDPLKANTA